MCLRLGGGGGGGRGAPPSTTSSSSTLSSFSPLPRGRVPGTMLPLPPPSPPPPPSPSANKQPPNKLRRKSLFRRSFRRSPIVSPFPPMIPSDVMLPARAACESRITLGLSRSATGRSQDRLSAMFNAGVAAPRRVQVVHGQAGREEAWI